VEFTVEIDILKEPTRFEKYTKAFMYSEPLDTGTRVVEATYSAEDGTVICTFKLRS
jgi:hypothetical protein